MEPLAILSIIKKFPISHTTFEYQISISTEMVFSSNFNKISKQYCKWDTNSYKSKDFLLNPICILYIIVCLYMLFYEQSIQIKCD